MKKILIIAMIAISGCSYEKQSQDISGNFILNNDLKDCKINWIRSDRGSSLHVVRCPNSQTTTTTLEKHPVTTAVIETLEKEVQDKQLKLEALKKLSPQERKALGLE